MPPARPRPRPRLRTETPGPSTSADAAADTASGSKATSSNPAAKGDDYDIFIRHRAPARRVSSQRDEETKSDSDESIKLLQASPDSGKGGGSKKRRRGEEGPVKIKGTADWVLQAAASASSNSNGHRPKRGRHSGSTSPAATDLDLHTDHSSDDSDIHILGNSKDNTTKPRAKSRSPTPPAPLTRERREEIRGVVKRHILSTTASATTTASTSAAASQQASKPAAERASEEVELTADSPNAVSVVVQWIPHPSAQAASAPISHTFIHDRHETLRKVFRQLADKLNRHVRDLVVMKDDQPISQAAVPAKLVGEERTLHLTACDEHTRKTILHERRMAADAKLKQAADPPPSPSYSPARHEASSSRPHQPQPTHARDATPNPAPAAAPARKIAVSIRSSARSQAVILRVKTSMTCASLLKHYLKELGSGSEGKGNTNTRLQLDGEDLDGARTLGDVMEENDFDEDEEEVQLDVAGL